MNDLSGLISRNILPSVYGVTNMVSNSITPWTNSDSISAQVDLPVKDNNEVEIILPNSSSFPALSSLPHNSTSPVDSEKNEVKLLNQDLKSLEPEDDKFVSSMMNSSLLDPTALPSAYIESNGKPATKLSLSHFSLDLIESKTWVSLVELKTNSFQVYLLLFLYFYFRL